MHSSSLHRLLTAALLILGALAVWRPAAAQHALVSDPAPQNVLQLSATGSTETQQDLLAISLSVTREAPDAAAVQTQLKSVLDSALADARRSVLPGQMEARSGRFSVSARYGREGRIAAWTGTAELILDGRDFFLISQTAGRITGMTVSGMAFSLSREQLQRAEALAQQQAVERFRGRATELARGFGFSSYTLREVSVQSGEQAPPPRPRMLALEARSAASDAPVPVEAGRSTVMVTISGSVQLQ